MTYLLLSFAGAFGRELVLILFWKLATRQRKWRKYQERVQKVAEKLTKLQESNEMKGGRQYFKLKPVSRRKANKIFKAQKKREELQKLEEEAAKKEEEKERKEAIRQVQELER